MLISEATLIGFLLYGFMTSEWCLIHLIQLIIMLMHFPNSRTCPETGPRSYDINIHEARQVSWPPVDPHTHTHTHTQAGPRWLLAGLRVTPGLAVFWQMVWICSSERQITINLQSIHTNIPAVVGEDRGTKSRKQMHPSCSIRDPQAK